MAKISYTNFTSYFHPSPKKEPQKTIPKNQAKHTANLQKTQLISKPKNRFFKNLIYLIRHSHKVATREVRSHRSYPFLLRLHQLEKGHRQQLWLWGCVFFSPYFWYAKFFLYFGIKNKGLPLIALKKLCSFCPNQNNRSLMFWTNNDSQIDDSLLNQILESIYDIESYVAGKTHEEFLNTSMMRWATIKQLEMIAQLAEQVPDQLVEEYQEIPWEEVRSFGKNLRHEYYGINYEKVWRCAKTEIPALRKQIERLLDRVR
jgi:uncharacterized protein with HEPN domain